jgi:single-strand binding family protein|nr:MAG TPA: Single strand binding protein [Caudoviricetes sp.]
MNNFSLIKGYVSRKTTTFHPARDGKKAVFSTTIAVATGTVDGEGKKVYNWVPVKSFGKTAELMNENLVGGDYTEITGRLGMNPRYTNKKGETVYETCFLVATQFSRLTQRETPKATEVAQEEVENFAGAPEVFGEELEGATIL